MDTVLGLSLTSTAVGWVLVEGRDATGAPVDHDSFTVRTGGAARASGIAEQTTAVVLCVRARAGRHDQRVRVIGLTWSDDVAAEAALLVESLTEAGLDNVVPVAMLQAAELVAPGIAPVVGFAETAVCVLDGGSAAVAMVDTAGGRIRTAVEHLSGGPERLSSKLSAMFDRNGWHPGGVVAVGADHELEALSRQLEKALSVPVLTQNGPELALARGAALASARSTEFTDAEIFELIGRRVAAPKPARSRSYAAAVSMLAAGVVTFVASLSLAVGPRLLPDRPPAPVDQTVHRSASPPAVVAPAPPPPAVAAPRVEQHSGFADEPAADLRTAEPEPPSLPEASPPAP